jgi:hypothetical protein
VANDKIARGKVGDQVQFVCWEVTRKKMGLRMVGAGVGRWNGSACQRKKRVTGYAVSMLCLDVG